jgi:membrane protein
MTTASAPATRHDDSSQQPTSVFSMLKQTVADWSEDKAMKLSAALALYTILSLAPLMLIAIKVLTMFMGEGAKSQVKNQMTALVGSAGGQAIAEMIDKSSKSGSGTIATIISLVILLVSASGVFGELQDSLNTIWEVKPKPGQGILATIKNRLLSMGMVFVIAFLLLVSLLVSTLLTTLTGYVIDPSNAWVAIPVDIVVSIVAVTLLIGAIFKFLPDVKLGWRDIIVGAFVTSVLFKLGQYGLGLYFKYGSSTSAYGAAGSFVAVLLWVYYSAWILFFGAEFTQVYAKAHGREIEPTANAFKVTEEDRAQQGIPTADRLERKSRGADTPGKNVPGPSERRSPSRSTSEWEVREREWD